MSKQSSLYVGCKQVKICRLSKSESTRNSSRTTSWQHSQKVHACTIYIILFPWGDGWEVLKLVVWLELTAGASLSMSLFKPLIPSIRGVARMTGEVRMTQGVLGACYPRKFGFLGSLKCYFLHFYTFYDNPIIKPKHWYVSHRVQVIELSNLEFSLFTKLFRFAGIGAGHLNILRFLHNLKDLQYLRCFYLKMSKSDVLGK